MIAAEWVITGAKLFPMQRPCLKIELSEIYHKKKKKLSWFGSDYRAIMVNNLTLDVLGLKNQTSFTQGIATWVLSKILLEWGNQQKEKREIDQKQMDRIYIFKIQGLTS